MARDDLDGCDLDFTEDETPDEMIPWVVLFATADEHDRGLLGKITHKFDVKQLAAEWKDLFGSQEIDAT